MVFLEPEIVPICVLMTVDEITPYSSLAEGDKHNDIGSFENKQIPSEIEGFKVREMEK